MLHRVRGSESEKDGGEPMKSPHEGARPDRCPVCNVSVRRDQIVNHLTSVHPGQKDSPAVRRFFREQRRSGREVAVKPKHRTGWWTPWRIGGVVALVLFASVVAYALTKTPGGVATGRAAPDFTFTGLSGSPSSLSAYEGHPLVLWWVATWCSSCSSGTQLFAQSYYSQYHSAGVTLLEIESYNDLGQSGPSVSNFASANGYTGQAGWVFGAGSSAGTSQYNPNGYLDYYYVISAQGTIIAQGASLAGNFASALQAATGS